MSLALPTREQGVGATLAKGGKTEANGRKEERIRENQEKDEGFVKKKTCENVKTRLVMLQLRQLGRSIVRHRGGLHHGSNGSSAGVAAGILRASLTRCTACRAAAARRCFSSSLPRADEKTKARDVDNDDGRSPSTSSGTLEASSAASSAASTSSDDSVESNETGSDGSSFNRDVLLRLLDIARPERSLILASAATLAVTSSISECPRFACLTCALL